jgi:peptidoglycan/xylan/chitin deacetylase (PgdA/CDA1 family)
MGMLRKSLIVFFILAVLGGLAYVVYYLAEKEGGSSDDKWADGLSLDEAKATYDPENNTFKSYNNCGDRRFVALTFDDGPNIETTPTVLQHLKAAGAKATFFVSPAVAGSATIEQCQLIPTILEEGHSIQSHSWNHENFQGLSNDEIALNLFKVRQWVEDCAGDHIDKLSFTQFRPPYGELSGDRAEFVTDLGYTIAGWNIDSGDAGALSGTDGDGKAESAQEAFATILSKYETDLSQSGSVVILMHDRSYKEDGVRGLIPLITNHFGNLGYTFVDGETCWKDCQPFGVGICEDTSVWPRFKTL